MLRFLIGCAFGWVALGILPDTIEWWRLFPALFFASLAGAIVCEREIR